MLITISKFSKNFCSINQSSLRPIKNIPFLSENLSKLDTVYKIPSIDKNQLNKLKHNYLKQICSDINAAKKSFQEAQTQINDLYKFIKNRILSESDSQLNQKFFEKAHYYFQKQGKKIRPVMVQMCAKNYKSLLKNLQKNIQIQDKIYLWSALIEMMHIASLAHDDVVDDSPSRRGQQSQHIKFGRRTAIFSGNYIISKASKTVAELESKRLYEIYANTMNSLAEGQIKQLISKNKYQFSNKISEQQKGLQQMINRYMQKTYYKSAALMSNSLLGVMTLFGQKYQKKQLQNTLKLSYQQIEDKTFKIGQHYGLALQLVDDILDYISTAEQMGKQQMSDLIQGNVTAPVFFNYYHDRNVLDSGQKIVTIPMLNKKKKNKQQALLIKKWVQSGVGIQLTYILAAKHILEGIKNLEQLGLSEEQLLGWRYLGHKLMIRRK